MKSSLLILGHGSRSNEAVAIFNRVVESIKKESGYEHVRGAHMELAEPDPYQAAEYLVGQAIEQIIVAPYFLYEGMHFKQDIPDIIDNLRKKYPQIDIKLAKPIGFEPVLASIILQRVREALE